MNCDPMTKKALVLAGGGSRGAYQIGAWQALREIGYDCSVVTGASVGALNGAMIAQGDFDKAKYLWEHISLEQVLDISVPSLSGASSDLSEMMQTFMKELIRSGGAGFTALKTLLEECINEDVIRASCVRLGIVTVKLPGYTPCVKFIDEIPQGMLIDYLLASSACFPAMKSYIIQGEKYIDGGYYDNLPIEMAQTQDVDEIFAIELNSPGRRRYDSSNYRVHILRPKRDLGFFLSFDADQAKLNLQYGYLDTMKYFDRMEGYLYSFPVGTWENACQHLQASINLLCDKLHVNLEDLKHSSVSSTARIAITRLLHRYCDKHINLTSFVRTMAECCAESLQIDAAGSYSIQAYHEQIHSKFALTRKKMISIESVLQEEGKLLLSLSRLKTILSQVDHDVILMLCYQAIQRALQDETKLSLLWLICSAAPKECLGALYLKLIYE